MVTVNNLNRMFILLIGFCPAQQGPLASVRPRGPHMLPGDAPHCGYCIRYQSILRNLKPKTISLAIGLYRDVWIAAIASSRTSLATRTAAICVRFHGRRVRHVYITMQITFLTRKSALIYRRGLRQRVASLTLDCNGVFAI